MPSDLTIFAAKYLVYLDGLLALVVLALVLYRRPRTDALRWLVAIGVTLLLSFMVAQVVAALYNDPRPFTQDHVKPLIAHAADNGFPSDHALLAAGIVAAVFLAEPLWAVPFVVLGFLVDWARVGAGIHHVVDVVGSSVIVAVALLVAWLLAPALIRWLVPRVPPAWLESGPVRRGAGAASDRA